MTREHQRDDHHEIRSHHRDTTGERHLAAQLAAHLASEQYAIQINQASQAVADKSVRDTASSLYSWLVGPVRMHLSRGPVRDQATGDIAPHHHHEGDHVATIMTDTQQCSFSVSETDAKGNPTTADQISWFLDDPTVGVLSVSDDTMSCNVVASAPGTANLTATDVNDTTITGVEAIQVTGGAATAIVITPGTPTAQ